MKFIKVNNKKTEQMSFKNKESLKVVGRDVCAVHNDTDSVYFSFNEAVERIKTEGLFFDTETQKRAVYEKIENIMQSMFDKVLELRAKKSHTENKIKFNRENIFSSMFCFAKKLYIGNVIDSEGHRYDWNKPKHKIMGVPIKRSDSPVYCREASEQLAFDICNGQGHRDSEKFIKNTFEEFKKLGPEVISGKKSISDYNKYVTEPIEHYLENGFYYSKGQTFNAKCALAYNYVIAKYKLPYTPIFSGNKFNYVYIKPTNRFNMEAIAFIGKWPKEFDDLFEIDYELMFRKAFIPLFENMFQISKWIGEKDTIKFDSDELNLEDLFG